MRVGFPEGFLWGAGTSAHQVEGDNTHSDWWRAEQAGSVPFKSGRAAQQYGRYGADFDLAAELGHNAHRLSVEWARIEPEPGVFDEREIAHYVKVLRALKDRGLTTFVALHHFTNPAWFADRGGWTCADAPALFECYVRAVVTRMSPSVDFWITVNEPSTVPMAGYVIGTWPPNKRLALFSAARMLRTLAQAHVLAYRAIHEAVPDAKVGYAAAFLNWRPKNERSGWQRGIARMGTGISNHWFSDRVGDLTDFVGVQYYITIAVGWRPYFPSSKRGLPASDIGWDIVPSGIHDVVLDTWKRYRKPIYVTENGLADSEDLRREFFIRDHLTQLRRAMDEGADVRGYLHWALIDNFEWALGYTPRFGLAAVDFDTQTRVPRPSALAYKQIIQDNGFEVEMVERGDLSDNDRVEALAEYKALHDEIGRHDTQMFEMFKFALTGAVAILAFALQQRAADSTKAWQIAAIVPFVVVPAGLFSLARMQMQMRIGAYLQVFHEERSKVLRWEQSLSARAKQAPLPDVLLTTSIIAGYAAIGLAGLIVAWIIQDQSELARWVLGAESALVAVLGIVAVVELFRLGGRKDFSAGHLQAFTEMRDKADELMR